MQKAQENNLRVIAGKNVTVVLGKKTVFMQTESAAFLKEMIEAIEYSEINGYKLVQGIQCAISSAPQQVLRLYSATLKHH